MPDFKEGDTVEIDPDSEEVRGWTETSRDLLGHAGVITKIDEDWVGIQYDRIITGWGLDRCVTHLDTVRHVYRGPAHDLFKE